MPEAEPTRFNLRLTAELEGNLVKARKVSGRSMNAEILARLTLTFETDPATQLADIFRPYLSSLAASEQAKFIDQVAGAIEILVQARKRKS